MSRMGKMVLLLYMEAVSNMHDKWKQSARLPMRVKKGLGTRLGSTRL